MTIGDLIISVRAKIPDPPQGLLPPPIISGVGISVGAGTVPAGVYFFVVTQFNAYGESLPSVEQGPVNVVSASAIDFTFFGSPDAVSGRVYLTIPGQPSGSESLAYDFTVPAGGLPGTISILNYPTYSAFPPTRSSAWLPQTDGQQFSCTRLYQWLNQGLNKLSHAVGGILDYCGVPSVSGQPLYILPGQWLSISDVWYGGYWVQGGNRRDFFRRNTVTASVLANVTVSITSNKQVMEISYQPDRNSGVTNTTADMQATDTSVPIANGSVFLLPFGIAQIGTEFVAYANLTSSSLPGLIRGIGGTVPQFWPSGTTVTELPLFWCGRRIFDSGYSPVPTGPTGPADPVSTIIPVPAGWKTILEDYMLAQAKMAEQDVDAGEKLEQQAFASAEKWMYANRGVAQFVQVGYQNRPVVYDDTIAGGLIMPS